MPDNIVIPDRDRAEELEVQVPVPDASSVVPDMLITTKRKGGIVRQMPLTESHGMTTEADRFQES